MARARRNSMEALAICSCSRGQKSFEDGVSGRRPGLAEVACDGADDLALLGRVSEDFGVRDDVLGVAMTAVPVYVVPNFIQHGRSGEPLAVFQGKMMERLERRE